jgi:hypothetical protein
MERLDGETIVIDFESGRFYSFRESAADILWLITQGVDSSDFAEIMKSNFAACPDDATLEQDLNSFLETLENLNVLSPVNPVNPHSDTSLTAAILPNDYIRGDWVNPILTSNDELADLLAIDPIHEANESGWPQTPTT